MKEERTFLWFISFVYFFIYDTLRNPEQPRTRIKTRHVNSYLACHSPCSSYQPRLMGQLKADHHLSNETVGENLPKLGLIWRVDDWKKKTNRYKQANKKPRTKEFRKAHGEMSDPFHLWLLLHSLIWLVVVDSCPLFFSLYWLCLLLVVDVGVTILYNDYCEIYIVYSPFLYVLHPLPIAIAFAFEFAFAFAFAYASASASAKFNLYRECSPVY